MKRIIAILFGKNETADSQKSFLTGAPLTFSGPQISHTVQNEAMSYNETFEHIHQESYKMYSSKQQLAAK